MSLPSFAPMHIDWISLTGGTEEVAWIADHSRKVATISKLSETVIDIYNVLHARDELFKVTPEALKTFPFAAHWYISLAGYAQKTLTNIHHRPKSHGMSVLPTTLAENLSNPHKRERLLKRVAEQPAGKDAKNIQCFSDWLNYEIEEIFLKEMQIPAVALTHVSMILGGRVIGQGQNSGGNDAVLLVKQQLVLGLRDKIKIYTNILGGSIWREYEKPSDLDGALKIRLGATVVVEFLGGGNNPDIAVRADEAGQFIAVGEIKGRKDLSNVWESWMPQVADHLKSWKNHFPEAHRIFIGTLITEQMTAGISSRGTQRTGLRALHEDGSLTTAFNIAKIVEGDHSANAHFGIFLDYLHQLVDHFLSISEADLFFQVSSP